MKLTFYTTFFVILTIATAIIIYFVIFFIRNKNVTIKTGFKTIHFLQEATTALSRDVDTTIFLKNEEKLLVRSQNGQTKNDGQNVLLNNHIITPHIRGKVYEGDTEKIETDEKNETFNVPNEMLLKNGHTNYIHAQNVFGNFDGKIVSNLPVEINDDNIFLSGDNMHVEKKNNYILITNNSHIINTKKKQNKQKQQEKNDIRSKKMEFFGLQKFAEFTTKVIFTTTDNVIKADFAKAYFNDKNEIAGIFLRHQIDIKNANIHATSNYGYFDTEANLAVLYDNVVLVNQTATLNNNIYVYNTESKTGMSFNEHAYVTKTEAIAIYNVLEKLAKELSQRHRRFINKIIQQHKKNIKEHLNDSDNAGIYRSKRAKINLYEK